MSAADDRPAAGGTLPASPEWTVRRARWFLLGLHLALVVVSPLFTVTGFQDDPGDPVVAVLAGGVIGALQFRHSLAAARGERPRAWPWTLLALTVLAYLPLVWFTWDWAVMQSFVIASAAMLLARRTAAIFVAGTVLGVSVAGAVEGAAAGLGAAPAALLVVYWNVGLLTGGIALYGSVRLVRVAEELHAARTELAELAVGRERLRVSRDLHDLLGQSLSAVSLKGDLALRLLPGDAPAARAEIRSLTTVARDALGDMRAVTRDEHAVSLRAETDGAAALLADAGVDAHIDVDLPGLLPAADRLLAWAVREGVTNMLRHGRPLACSITAGRRGDRVRLEIVNDGVRPAGGTGSGLAGLADRARTLSGRVSAGRTRGGRFTLVVEIPEEDT